MKRQLFYRNVNARDNLEIFLVSAISSLLLLRFFLYEAGYPQVGGGSLHIAHMLYGGLLMLVAITLNLAFLGERVRRWSALLGGIGFGVFIDELGKFLTKDNNYFFRPTIGLIYAIFMILYLLFNFLSRDGRLTKREYELNALAQLEEAVLQDLDSVEKRRIAQLLAKADQQSPVTRELKQLLARLDTVPASKPNWLQGWLATADKRYARFWHGRSTRRLVGAVFVAQAAVFLIVTLGTVFGNFDDLRSIFQAHDSYADKLIIGQLITSVASGIFAVLGAVKIFSSRLQAFELFRRAVLINLLLTEFFVFSRIQFRAMPGFLVNLVLLVALRYAINEEHRAKK
ncbi:MAG TPA: hypothetical protein VK712_01080 [Verrucomicrobiae bacterium]|jgi:hypothetical protein|nr:hypothetical protein [Verrucomicrobiae bacterium]